MWNMSRCLYGTTSITIQASTCPHWCTNSFSIIHSKLLEHVLDILALTHKCAILHLLDLKTKEVTKLSNHGYLKLTCHHLAKLLTKILIGWSKYDVINIDLQHKQVFSNLLDEKSGVNLAIMNPLESRKSLNLSYHALGACFKPYNAFFNLYTWLGFLSSSKLGGYSTYTSSLM